MPEARAYLGDGRLELDNNICERSIRPVAPGRKNCLFLGSVGGGEAAAIAYALIETAKMNNVDPEAWLTWVLERVADHGLTPSTNLCRGTGSPKTSKTRPDRTDTTKLNRPVFNGEWLVQMLICFFSVVQGFMELLLCRPIYRCAPRRSVQADRTGDPRGIDRAHGRLFRGKARDGRSRLVRHGHLPEREVLTGEGLATLILPPWSSWRRPCGQFLPTNGRPSQACANTLNELRKSAN